jgi:phosphoglycerate dehydrogenase-like enzyme
VINDQCAIVFHGELAGAYAVRFEEFLHSKATITNLPDAFTSDSDRRLYASANVIVSFRFDRTFPVPPGLKLFQVPGAGYDAVDLEALPPSAVVCNCFGHEQAIAEYVLGALIMWNIPFTESDRNLRKGDWAYRGGPADTVHGELANKTIGVLGFGHIGKALAQRAKAFEMNVLVANRSPIEESPFVDRSFGLDQLLVFCSSSDYIVATLPLTPETRGIVGAAAFVAMRSTALVVNVGRGPIIDEDAFFEALKSRRIGGAIIDTWYNYPSQGSPMVFPALRPFHELPNVVMTPHMSGWTGGTIRRRQAVIADNIERTMRGETCINIVRGSKS